jgi:hypothetical protein
MGGINDLDSMDKDHLSVLKSKYKIEVRSDMDQEEPKEKPDGRINRRLRDSTEEQK